jgi:Arc/MetJ-type ribon-helix-helix transcriptional regulator
MPTRNVNLTEHFDPFVEAGVTSGRFSDASELRFPAGNRAGLFG